MVVKLMQLLVSNITKRQGLDKRVWSENPYLGLENIIKG